MAPQVILVGLPGAGKSTSGRRLAKILCVPFADSDDLVERAEGRTVRAIFAASGEAAFRVAEHAAIAACLASASASGSASGSAGDFAGVLSLGGGALTHEPTRLAVAESGVPVAVLQAPLPTLLARVGDGRTRPLLRADPQGRLSALAQERQPIYESVASLLVDTDRRTPGQVAAHIAARLHTMGALA